MKNKIVLIDAAISTLLPKMSHCDLCFRDCGTDRSSGVTGFCGAASDAKVYSFSSHSGEEPPLSGMMGSGTIFFSHCNMGCVYCQNYRFSHEAAGKVIDVPRLADIMLDLEARGCHNINLVSPTHFVPRILEALKIAYQGGLRSPIIYNTGGYDHPEVIRTLDGIVDVYLPDMRYASDEMAVKYSSAPGYVDNNRKIVLEMLRQAGHLKLDNMRMAERGVIIRLLILPGNISGTIETLRFISKEIGTDVYLSVMSQYYPAYKAMNFPGIDRRVEKREYDEVIDVMEELGFSNGWVQPFGGDFNEELAGENFPPGI
ncbi:MAG: radical SAM protein [Candidatus Omnitrophica bacterium]|nr:radical SAM protein [Candidatus Omnitrophota bacterium]